jgi:hypothetical protein
MSFFKGSHNHHEITAYVHTDGSVTYTTEAIPDDDKSYRSAKEFTSLSAIEAAIDKYELSLRKNFVNPQAYMIQQGEGWPTPSKRSVVAVTVTSITSDGKEVWIKTAKDERRKVYINDLFAHQEVCQAYVDALDATSTVYRRECENLKDVLDRSQWKPKKGEGKS